MKLYEKLFDFKITDEFSMFYGTDRKTREIEILGVDEVFILWKCKEYGLKNYHQFNVQMPWNWSEALRRFRIEIKNPIIPVYGFTKYLEDNLE